MEKGRGEGVSEGGSVGGQGVRETRRLGWSRGGEGGSE